MSGGFDLRNLDTSNPGGWPGSVKAFFCVLLAALILFLGWYLVVKDQQESLAGEKRKEGDLRSQFEQKQARAVNLEPLKQQLADMELMLQQMLRQLPSRTEMADLIVDISQTALASGIQNELFQPLPENKKEFYAEKPIALRMVGSYHQFGAFVSGVASLPRVVIMTMHDISLKPRDAKDGSGSLVLEGTVKTYRYLDEDEDDSAAATTQGGAR
ncbi:MAG: type 4a pilus biogenesis protein PilO [Lysobacteraceae bacterium]|uniref:type 4a pilus biogenesis protein PilO n=1 Tax=Denitratimonas sp. CY0512 TaxID=3131940 RepID=UPI0016956F5D|nr:type 4a pilus biogenesis protein PilO [Gammaproteobacteria bacterium]